MRLISTAAATLADSGSSQRVRSSLTRSDMHAAACATDLTAPADGLVAVAGSRHRVPTFFSAQGSEGRRTDAPPVHARNVLAEDRRRTSRGKNCRRPSQVVTSARTGARRRRRAGRVAA